MHSIILFSLICFFILWIAKAKGFFILPHNKEVKTSLSFRMLSFFFIIYLTITLFLSPLLMHAIGTLYAKMHPTPPTSLIVLNSTQLLVIASIFLCFFLYARIEDSALFKRIIKNRSTPQALSISADIAMGVLTWFIAFPCVLLIGEIADMIVYALFGMENYEQVAVRYLKMNLSSLEALFIPLFLILLAAPAIEEFLFRGLLQNFFKKYLGIKRAILFSSLCFALFHFSLSQGVGNIPLLISLFTFALFLGFIYERQGSLFASIALHISFNTFSTIRIVFFPE